jgi:hypothetical protein
MSIPVTILSWAMLMIACVLQCSSQQCQVLRSGMRLAEWAKDDEARCECLTCVTRADKHLRRYRLINWDRVP